MNTFKADLHIHSCLSPCGSLELSPLNIIESALKQSLDIIAITDHNSTKQATIIKDLAADYSLTVYVGAEITTSEEIHVLGLFDDKAAINEIQSYIDHHITKIKNKPNLFGYQVVVDKDEQIIEEIDTLLTTSLNVSIHDVERKIHDLGGLFIPAHIDKKRTSICSQLGFIPQQINADAFEISKHTTNEDVAKHIRNLTCKNIVRNSDAHYPYEIGNQYNIFKSSSPEFRQIRRLFESRTPKPLNY